MQAQDSAEDSTGAVLKVLEDEMYSISYPEEWRADQSGMMGTQFIILSPLESAEDRFQENVNLFPEDLNGVEISLNEYIDIAVTQISNLIQDGELVSSDALNKDDQDYHRLVYTGKQGVYSLKFMQYFWILNGNAYVLTFTAEENKFEKYLDQAEEIMATFIIK